MKWKAELVEIRGADVVKDEFLRLYQHCILIALKEERILSPMQFRRAEELLGQYL